MTPPKVDILRWRQGPRLTIRIRGQYKNFYFSTSELAVGVEMQLHLCRWRHSSRISKCATGARAGARGTYGGAKRLGGFLGQDHWRVENINQKCMPKESGLWALCRAGAARRRSHQFNSNCDFICAFIADRDNQHTLTHRYPLTHAGEEAESALLPQFKAFTIIQHSACSMQHSILSTASTSWVVSNNSAAHLQSRVSNLNLNMHRDRTSSSKPFQLQLRHQFQFRIQAQAQAQAQARSRAQASAVSEPETIQLNLKPWQGNQTAIENKTGAEILATLRKINAILW